MSKSKKSNWEIEFDKVLEGEWGDHFGHNVEVDKKYFRQLEKLGADIQIEDEYTIKIKMPNDSGSKRENILLSLLTKSPMPSECRYNKKTDILTVEWHF